MSGGTLSSSLAALTVDREKYPTGLGPLRHEDPFRQLVRSHCGPHLRKLGAADLSAGPMRSWHSRTGASRDPSLHRHLRERTSGSDRQKAVARRRDSNLCLEALQTSVGQRHALCGGILARPKAGATAAPGGVSTARLARRGAKGAGAYGRSVPVGRDGGC